MDKKIIAGIGIGPITDISQIKILICYLLNSIDIKLTQNQIHEILNENSLVSYFSLCETITSLLDTGHISVVKENSDDYFQLNELGVKTSTELESALPPSLRDSVITTAIKSIARIKVERENNVVITKNENGYMVTCTITTGNFNVMTLSLYAPDLIQAEKIKEHFYKDPIKLYQSIINDLLD